MTLKEFLTQYQGDAEVKDQLEWIKEWALKLADTPCREGDGLPEDEIIEDSIQQAHVRQTIKFAIEESAK